MAKKNKIDIELDIADLLGLSEPKKDSLEYDLTFILENGIDKYKELQDNKQKAKDEFVDMLFDSYVMNKLKNRLIRDGFVYQCKYCWGLDVSGQYGKATKPKY